MDDKTITVALTEGQWLDVLGELMSACSNQCTLAYWTPGTEHELPPIAREAARTGQNQAWGDWFVFPDAAIAVCAIADALGYWATWNEAEMRYEPYAPKDA